jgi:hypothetical protein
MPQPLVPRRLRRPLGRLVREVRSGIDNAGAVPIRRQLQLWRHGFYAQNAFLYEFDKYGFDAYVSDLDRAMRLERINDPTQRAILNDKLVAFLFLRAVRAPTPTLFGFANGDRPVFFDEAGSTGGIEELLAREEKLVVKPRGGSGGSRFALLERDGDRLLMNGEPTADLGESLRGRMVISQFIEQHRYASEIYPHTTNTMRLLVLRDADTREPFLAAATHRFGTRLSAPVDNVGKGGYAAEVDVETGVMGPLASLPRVHFSEPGPVKWLDEHPETGARVAGTAVPGWSHIVEEILRATRTLEGLKCVGWDVAVTQEGAMIIEGNNRPDVVMQVHGPFLTDERKRRAFESAGVVRRSPR